MFVLHRPNTPMRLATGQVHSSAPLPSRKSSDVQQYLTTPTTAFQSEVTFRFISNNTSMNIRDRR